MIKNVLLTEDNEIQFTFVSGETYILGGEELRIFSQLIHDIDRQSKKCGMTNWKPGDKNVQSSAPKVPNLTRGTGILPEEQSIRNPDS